MSMIVPELSMMKKKRFLTRFPLLDQLFAYLTGTEKKCELGSFEKCIESSRNLMADVVKKL